MVSTIPQNTRVLLWIAINFLIFQIYQYRVKTRIFEAFTRLRTLRLYEAKSRFNKKTTNIMDGVAASFAKQVSDWTQC